MDPSPRDHQITTCAKSGISGNDRKAYLMTCGGTRSVRSPLNQTHRDHTIFIGRGFIGRSRSFTISGSGSTAWTHFDHPISIGRTTLDSSRVHDCGDHHRLWIEIFIRRHRKAHLLTRGQKWCVRSSSNVKSKSTA